MKHTDRGTTRLVNPPKATLDRISGLSQRRDFGRVLELCLSSLEAYPESAVLWSIAGTSAINLGQNGVAVQAFEQSLAFDPKPETFAYLSVANYNLGNLKTAIENSRKAIELKPDIPLALKTLAGVYHKVGDAEQALKYYTELSDIDPACNFTRAQKLFFQAKLCDWSARHEYETFADTLGLQGDFLSPWPLLTFEDNPERQAGRSAYYSSQWAIGPRRFSRRDGKKIRIGYFSSDLKDHATMHLLIGVFESHDRSKFEIFVYGLNSPPSKSTCFERMAGAIDHFRDLHATGDADVIGIAREDDLDIAIDLKGFTADARPQIFAAGLAPVQMNYLGYPGTLGSKCYDYIVADHAVIPEEYRQWFTENVVFLPHTYQPNDDQRVAPVNRWRRSDCELPEQAIVLCCFNNTYKISPEEFSIWMRVLRRVENSVLWILDAGETFQRNLSRQAEKRGVAADRLVFAPMLSQADHLSRLSCADIFVDTFNVNAHTTASDALWAGVPVVTRSGKQFAARVAGSLLQAAGLPELIALTSEAYEELVVSLAEDHERLSELRARLSETRLSMPLFDTARYTQYLEVAFEVAAARARNGLPPTDLDVLEDMSHVVSST